MAKLNIALVFTSANMKMWRCGPPVVSCVVTRAVAPVSTVQLEQSQTQMRLASKTGWRISHEFIQFHQISSNTLNKHCESAWGKPQVFRKSCGTPFVKLSLGSIKGPHICGAATFDWVGIIAKPQAMLLEKNDTCETWSCSLIRKEYSSNLQHLYGQDLLRIYWLLETSMYHDVHIVMQRPMDPCENKACGQAAHFSHFFEFQPRTRKKILWAGSHSRLPGSCWEYTTNHCTRHVDDLLVSLHLTSIFFICFTFLQEWVCG